MYFVLILGFEGDLMGVTSRHCKVFQDCLLAVSSRDISLKGTDFGMTFSVFLFSNIFLTDTTFDDRNKSIHHFITFSSTTIITTVVTEYIKE